jgi:GxGYxYP putative glycoside hydrolase C-terminal domain/GxGYxY sequence motif in domain of unknown function N-terminal
MKLVPLLLSGALSVSLLFPAMVRADSPVETSPDASKTPALRVAHYDLSDFRAGANPGDPQMLRFFYDDIFLVTSLQGLVNRDGPKLMVRYNPELDDFWWKILKQPGNWMEHSDDYDIKSLKELLTTFRSAYNGAVVYDESIPSTSNVAAAVAGADNLLVLRYDPSPDSLYTHLTTGPDALPIKVRLINPDGTQLFTGKDTIPGTDLPSTGSKKNDAYRWLIQNYLKTGKLDPTEVGYMVDAFWLRSWQSLGDKDDHMLNNLDYFIAKKHFVFDLDYASDEAPVDDPTQKIGTDFETICLLFKTCNNLNHNQKMIQLHGFVPWPFKYSDFKSNGYSAGGHLEPVASEWRFVLVSSAYNVLTAADPNNLPNTSFLRHYPLVTPVLQHSPPPTKEKLIKDGILNADGSIPKVTFYAHYAGDYDSAAWIYRYMPAIWSDPKRGDVPVSWPLNPNLDDMVAPYLYWMRQNAKGGDDFIAGDSGAGYVNAYQLSEPRQFSGLPSGVKVWEDYNSAAMKRWDLDVIGFVLDGNTPFMKPDALDAYARVAPGGIGTQNAPTQPVYHGMPMVHLKLYILPNSGLPSIVNSAKAVKDDLATSPVPFVAIRSVLWKPSEFVELEKQLDILGTVPRKLVDMRTLLWLVRYQAESKTAAH